MAKTKDGKWVEVVELKMSKEERVYWLVALLMLDYEVVE